MLRKQLDRLLQCPFWAKADSAKDIAIEFSHQFGSGGTPSSAVTAIGVTTKSLTTDWVKQTVTVTLPSVAGKTLGTDDNNNLDILIWFDAGSDFDARTNSLGQQSGTFDISNVQLEFGTEATEFEYVSPADQLARCQRYFERLGDDAMVGSGQCEATNSAHVYVNYSRKRAVPVVTFPSTASGYVMTIAGANATATSMSPANRGTTGCNAISVTSGLTAGQGVNLFLTTATYIDVDAEL